MRPAVIVSSASSIVAFVVVYVGYSHGPYYYPLEGEWGWDRAGSTLVMSWFGRVGASVLASVVVGVVVAMLSRAFPDRPAVHALTARFAVLLVLLTLIGAVALLVYKELQHLSAS